MINVALMDFGNVFTTASTTAKLSPIGMATMPAYHHGFPTTKRKTQPVHSVYPHYTMPGLTCTKTYVGPLWRNEFEELTNGNFPLPPWITDEYDEYKFKKSGTSGCDPYSVALDTTYFAHDTPERYLLIKNASMGCGWTKYLRDKAKAAGQTRIRNLMIWGPGSGIRLRSEIRNSHHEASRHRTQRDQQPVHRREGCLRELRGERPGL